MTGFYPNAQIPSLTFMRVARAVMASEIDLYMPQVDEDLGIVRIDVDGKSVTVDHMTDKVASEDQALAQRIDKARVRMLEAIRPCKHPDI
eukprot:scaffold132843_cov20-Prasinocladus_malaysianus.AAC.1